MYCGNNVFSRKLKQNGGTDHFGSPRECFRKGYGLGYNAPIGNVASFLEEWGGRYKPYIGQSLYYGDGTMPPGYQRATLSQSLSRGYALGRVAKAKKVSQEYLSSMRKGQNGDLTTPSHNEANVKSK